MSMTEEIERISKAYGAYVSTAGLADWPELVYISVDRWKAEEVRDALRRAGVKILKEAPEKYGKKYFYFEFPEWLKKSEHAETGIMRCRYCGAPYAYRENLELHERSCPKRG